MGERWGGGTGETESAASLSPRAGAGAGRRLLLAARRVWAALWERFLRLTCADEVFHLLLGKVGSVLCCPPSASPGDSDANHLALQWMAV